GTHQNRLHHTVGGDGRGQLGQLILIHMGTGLEGIAVDLIQGKFARLASFGVSGRSGGGLHARQKGVQPLAQGAAFYFGGSNGHGSKSSARRNSARLSSSVFFE